LLTIVLVGASVASVLGQIDVWIDPGHGGNEPGALGIDGAAVPNEKELNIGVAGYLENDLTDSILRLQDAELLHHISALGTSRSPMVSDRMISITSSCRLFASVHMNSVADSTAFGTETFYPGTKYDAKSKFAYRADSSAAKAIHADLMTYADVAFLFCSRDRGAKRHDYAVLRRTRPTALLFEVCFISNRCQFNNITSSGDQALIADGIAAGVSGYLGALRQEPQVSYQTPSPAPFAAGPALRMTVSSHKEGFEGGLFPPTGWTSQTAGLGLPYAWHRTTDSLYLNTGSGAALVAGESPSGVDEWLISPGVSLGGTDDAIKFSWSGSQIWSGVLDASLNIREVGISTWTLLWSMSNDEPPADPFIYRERIVDLSAWTGMNVEFGLRVVGTNGADFALDDIVVGDFAPTSTAPNDVCANATTLSDIFGIHDVTCYAGNDLDPYTPPPGSCVGNELDGPDVFYEILAASGDSLHAEVTAEWCPAIYVVDDCVNPVCLAGGYAEDGRTAPIVDYKFPAAGTYYLVVDGEEGSCGPYQLDGGIISTVSVAPGNGVVPSLSLAVHPNPAGGSIGFSGTFPSSPSNVPILDVYNAAGKRLLHVEGERGSSAFSYVWDRRDHEGVTVTPGLYFARLHVDRHFVVQKLVILE
jgi:N-acetylmuramoyl-L-alanine amidase